MAERKQTPDILSQILNGMDDAGDIFIENRPPKPARKPQTVKPAAPAEKKTAEKPKVTGQKWEYMLVSFQEHSHGWRPRYKNGVELENWMSAPVLHDYINQMGSEGWELAAVSAGERMFGSTDRHQVYFKRLKSSN